MLFTERVDQIKDHALDFARRKEITSPFLFVGKEDEFTGGPVVMGAIGEDGKPTMISMPPREWLPMLLKDMQPDSYVVAIEAYIKAMHPEDVSLYEHGDIAEDPDSKEHLLVFGCERPGPMHFWTALITNDDNGRTIGEWKLVSDSDDIINGVLAITEW